MSYTNADGLYTITHGDQGTVRTNGVIKADARKTLVWEIADATALATSAATPTVNDAYIPANALITSAYFIVETGFTSGGSGTLGLGLYEKDGTVIDADGIDAAVAKTAIDTVGEAVACDGALVDGTATVGTADAYVGALYATAAFTAGAGKLVIEYIEV